MNDFKTNRHILKFFALFMAITLWFYVLNSEPIEVEKRIALVFIPPVDMAVNVEVPKVVRVKIKGSRSFVQNLNYKNEKLFIDLKNYPYQQETFAVTFDPLMVPVPLGVEVLEVLPPQIVLSLDREIKKIVPVRAKLVGVKNSEIQLVKKLLVPKEMMIRGPREAIKKIGVLYTRPIDISLLKDEGQMKVSLEAIDSRVQLEGKEEVEFSYSLRPNTANLTLRDIPVHFLSTGHKVMTQVKSVVIDVLVPQEKEKTINKNDIKVIAEIPSGAKGEQRIPLRADLPDGMHLLRIYPRSIKVILK
jgi:YbbR domain-containing protein